MVNTLDVLDEDLARDRIVRQIVDFSRRSYEQPLDAAKQQGLTSRILDALGCAIAASEDAEVARVAQAIGFAGKSGPCTALLLGSGSPEDAAFLNGMMIRYHDWNDTYVGKNGGHPSDLIPVALAVGEAEGRSGGEVLRALGVGHHLMLDMCDGSNALLRGWDHATYVGICAVVVASLLMRLEPRQMAQALAMMVAANNMLLARSHKVSTWRSLASPAALRNAIFLARLAKADVSGPDPVFEGAQGFLNVVCGDMVLQLDAERDRSCDSHLKRYPAVFHAQAPIEIALDLRQEIASAFPDAAMTEIEELIVFAHAFAIKWAGSVPSLWEPANRETADHSIPFMVALALLRGHIHHDQIEAAISDEAVRSLTRKVRVVEDETYSARWPKESWSRIRLVFRGRVFEREVPAGKGHAARPLLPEQRAEKLIENASEVIGSQRARAWAAGLERFGEARAISALLQP